MLRSQAAFAAVVLLAMAGPASAASKTFEFGPFTSIDISSGLDAVVTVGGEPSVTAEAPTQEEIDELMIEVRDGTLRAWVDWNLFDLFQLGETRNTKLTITVPSLTRASASSGADVEVTGISGDAISLEASSGADLDVREAAGTAFDLESSSGADLSVEGTCARAEADSSSGSELHAERLLCADVNVNASSGADAEVHASASVNAEASSGSDIRIHGNPAEVEREASSGAEIELVD